jgi:carbonic anhydrase
MVDIIKDIFLNGNFRYRLKILKELEIVNPDGNIPKYPVLILTCMDPRIDVHRIFQLNPGDVFVLRNAGNLYTQDTLRAILLTIYQHNIQYIIILGHLDCVMTKLKMLELKKKVPYEFFPPRSREGLDLFSEVKDFFKPFMDELRNVKQQVEYLKRLSVHKQELTIIGMLYDVETGWVFEYERFKEFDHIEDFRKQFDITLRDKNFQFIDFVESIENEIVSNEETRKNFSQSVKHDEVEIIYEENMEKEMNIVANQNLKTETDKIIKTQIILPKIQFPKIHFPRVKIYMPKISRKKSIN